MTRVHVLAGTLVMLSGVNINKTVPFRQELQNDWCLLYYFYIFI